MEQIAVLPKLNVLNLPWPTDWGAVFGVERPLILDIGFGFGHTLVHLSQQHPDHNIVGLEISNFCLVKAERMIPRRGLDNVRVLFARAETALYHLFEPASLAQIHVNFPDPWFKDRHAGRRLIQRDTLDLMVNRLAPGGRFYLATDIAAYAEMSHDLLAATPALRNTLETPWADSLAGRIVTKYERKAIEAGRPRFFFAYHRENDASVPTIPTAKEWPMSHLIFKTPQNLDAMRASFSEMRFTQGDIRVKVMRVFQSDSSLLFETYIHEPTIEQQVGLVLATRRDHPDQYTLKPGAIGNPRPTEGMHVAVGHLGNWLLGLHPDSVVIEDKVKRDPV